jgi:subtilisin family serine protease
MRKTSFKASPKASTSLTGLYERSRGRGRERRTAARNVAFDGRESPRPDDGARVELVVELKRPREKFPLEERLGGSSFVERLDSEGQFWAASIDVGYVPELWSSLEVQRVETKRPQELRLGQVGAAVGVRSNPAARSVSETGAGVAIGIVDSGFDLAHPMFKDARGNLRVVGLLDQTTGKQYVPGNLAQAPSDGNGHGTHVASIAAGSPVGGFEGIAPDAPLLLVKTDLIRTDRAVRWIFDRATAMNVPCVVNLSLGHHVGPHDGTEIEEQLFSRLTRAPGRIIVVAAGNERRDRIHLGGWFHLGQADDIRFDVLQRGVMDAPGVTISAWYDDNDEFDGGLMTPTGMLLPFPSLGSVDLYDTNAMHIEIERKPYPSGRAVEILITLRFEPALLQHRDLRDWALRFICTRAVVGRVDAWMNNPGYGVFHEHPLLDESRIVGLPGTGDGSITVGSYVTKSQWPSDGGPQSDQRVVVGRISPFSSPGPTRDGRHKPDIVAPGQYVTAALASSGDLAQWQERVETTAQLLTLEGTSMAAPVVTGAIALLLQKNSQLTLAQVREALARSAQRDAHTGAMRWDPAYGYGKLDVAGALARV